MSDFPLVNGEYGKLFPKPNPPSRVTISCGDLLPPGVNIAVYLTAPVSSAAEGRNGLHVQSRSYWAPANIGPYSQAIDVPVTVRGEAKKLHCISIAGQIPLIPATMVLPPQSETSRELQVVLSLQHLWRVGQEMKVQYWTSSVAYFSRSLSATDMQRNAQVAGVAWKCAHGSPADDEDDDGPDPWDLKYNPAYMSLGDSEKTARRSVPDWSVFTLRQQNEPETCIPPMFAVEVEELPRQSAVEWHAHNGLSNIYESSLEIAYQPEVSTAGWRVWHAIVKDATARLVYIYTTVSCNADAPTGSSAFADIYKEVEKVYQESLGRLGSEITPGKSSLVYVDAVEVDSAWSTSESSGEHLAIIPCRSIWSSAGERVKIVSMFETALYT